MIKGYPYGTYTHFPCSKCGEIKPLEDFPKQAQSVRGHGTHCKYCTKYRSAPEDWERKGSFMHRYHTDPDFKEAAKEKAYKWRRENKAQFMWLQAKARAKTNGLAFNIDPEDVIIPEVCPVTLIPFTDTGNTAPTLDRIYPAKGYTKGNVVVVSKSVNCSKWTKTPEEIVAHGLKMADFYQQFIPQMAA